MLCPSSVAPESTGLHLPALYSNCHAVLGPPPILASTLLQAKELEELCAAQQNSLEEGEEKFRALQDEQDQLHHAALAAKAQLVTAQAQVCIIALCCSRLCFFA